MRYLRTNTATRITVGPFLDKSNGVTPETALDVTNEKLTLIVDVAGVPTLVLDTAPTAPGGGSNDMVHITDDDAGFYDLELAAADLNYVGRAFLSLTDASTHCAVFHELMIVPAQVYDSLVLGSDLLDSMPADLGAGAISWPITITVGGSPVDGVDVWISTDAQGENVIARGETNDSGIVTFLLDAGSYYAWKQLAGYRFTNPESFTVS